MDTIGMHKDVIKMEDNKINVRIPDGTGFGLADIEAKAKSLGLNRSEFVMKAVSMMMNFDEEFLKEIQGFSEGLHIPEWLVIQNMIINRLADEDAEYEVYGGGRRRLLLEFMQVGEGIERRTLTGKPLHAELKAEYVIKHEKDLVKQALEEEAAGAPLDEKEKELLIKYRVGHVWFESEEYKQVLEREALAKKQYKEIEEKYPEAAKRQKEYYEKMKSDLKSARET